MTTFSHERIARLCRLMTRDAAKVGVALSDADATKLNETLGHLNRLEGLCAAAFGVKDAEAGVLGISVSHATSIVQVQQALNDLGSRLERQIATLSARVAAAITHQQEHCKALAEVMDRLGRVESELKIEDAAGRQNLH